MTIKQGYDGKPTHLKFSAREGDSCGFRKYRTADFWIEQEGLSLIKTSKGAKATYRKGKLEDLKECELYLPDNETLAYITLDEVLALRDELNGLIQEMVA